jgi:hypothetical protein
MTWKPDPKQSATDTHACHDQPIVAVTNGDGPANRRQFFARFAGVGVKFAAAASLLPTFPKQAEAATVNAAAPLPPTEAEERAADVARLAATLAQPNGAAKMVSIYRYGKKGELTLQMVSPGVWRRCCPDGSLGEIVEVEDADRQGEWGIDSAGRLVVYDNRA